VATLRRVRRPSLAIVCACSLALFAALASSAAADETTPPATTPPPPTASPPPSSAPRASGPKLIQPGVTIGGLLVGGLTGPEARALVEERFEKPVTLVVSPSRKLRAEPAELGAAARVLKAVKTAVRVRTPGFSVPLTVDVKKQRLERFFSHLAEKTDREPVDASLTLKKFTPVAHEAKDGVRLKRVVAAQQLSLALRRHDRAPFTVPYETIHPKVTEQDLGQVIVIKRESRTLLYYDGTKLKRAFRVATGQSSYPTPIGKFEIITMQRNPWWYPPQTSAWAAGKEPVPPGPGNPLGTRWMGISSPYVGIHGTPDAASIGYSASHGCVRMLIPQVEWLFERVDVGTPVFIVRA
jgi:lipoprotein-anchoring transpeptidase ErfK/SrfK